jgi:dihydrofolate reductase
MPLKVILRLALSLDGFIAAADDSVPWSEAVWQEYIQYLRQNPCLIVGRRTYEIMRRENKFQKIGNPFTIVLTQTPPTDPLEQTAFVSSSKTAVSLLESRGFSTAVLGGGSLTNTAFLQCGLIHEMVLDIDSVFLGGGFPLFAPPFTGPKLRLQNTKNISSSVAQLHYTLTP